ncbi:MAG: CMP/dCMP kinase, partial [Solirubrobacteraceae bacterium]|nr:CMP/dCMP kinase [Solirubrobacteraceae bacterium]
SGAMYRALGLSLNERDGDPVSRAREIDIGLGDRITVDGRDVTEAIRTPEVAEAASRVATIKPVRAALVDKQRELLHDGGDWVAEGRDIGTVVAPDAELKVFLTASPEQRARRRADELGSDYDTVLRDQALRDQQDSQREHSPLAAATDSVEVDTTDLSVDQVVDEIAGLVHARRGQ